LPEKSSRRILLLTECSADSWKKQSGKGVLGRITTKEEREEDTYLVGRFYIAENRESVKEKRKKDWENTLEPTPT